MRMKSLILIFIALGCGLVASIGISQVMERGGSSGPGMEMEQILVALADIDNNKKLDATNVKLEDWPKAKVPEGAIRRLDDAKDKFAATRFYKGEPILISKLADQASSMPGAAIGDLRFLEQQDVALAASRQCIGDRAADRPAADNDDARMAIEPP